MPGFKTTLTLNGRSYSSEPQPGDEEKIRAAVANLPEQTRKVYTLRKVYRYDHPRIAARLGITEAEVGRALTDAMRACANALLAPLPDRIDARTSDVPSVADVLANEAASREREAQLDREAAAERGE